MFVINFDCDVRIEPSWYRWKALVEGYNFRVLSFARFLMDFLRREFYCCFPASLKYTPWKICEESHKTQNTKVVAFNESFPTVLRALNSDIGIKSYCKNAKRSNMLNMGERCLM